MVADPSAAFSRGDLMREVREIKDRVKALEVRTDLEAASIGRGGLAVKGGAIVIYDAQGVEQMRLSTAGLTLEGLLTVIGNIRVAGGTITILNDNGDTIFEAGPDGLTLQGLLEVIGQIIVESADGIRVLSGGNVEVEDGGYILARYADGSSAITYGSLFDAVTGDPDGHGLLVQDDQAGSGHDIFRAKRFPDGEVAVYVGETTEGTEHPVDQLITESLFTRIRTYDGGDGFLASFGGGNSVVAASGGGDARLSAFDGGAARLTAESLEAYTAYTDTGNAANCHLLESGQIMRSTSSRRVKQDIRNAEIDPDAVLRLQPRTWLPADELSGNAGAPADEQRKDGAPEGREPSAMGSRPRTSRQPQVRQVGFVSEELDDIGLGQFVEHDENGQAGGIAYDRLTAALVSLCQRQQAQIDALTAWAQQQGFQPPNQG